MVFFLFVDKLEDGFINWYFWKIWRYYFCEIINIFTLVIILVRVMSYFGADVKGVLVKVVSLKEKNMVGNLF